MLRITLEPQNQINKLQSNQNQNWHFELKVVNEGSSAELRLNFDPIKEKETYSIVENPSPKSESNTFI